MTIDLIDQGKDFHIHTVHLPGPIVVAAADHKAFHLLGVVFAHAGQVRLIPWGEITALEQGAGVPSAAPDI